MSTINWNEYYLNICEQIKLRSKDSSTKIGVVIVGEDKQIISTGYNSFPRGINDNVPERQERPEKYYWFSHAETNAIINAALNGTSTKGTIMYMSCGVPCTDCARNIINAGIKHVHCKKVCSTANSGLWEEHAKRSLEMFKEAGVMVTQY
jgi:dCMP deaminase